jgi:hypothetical protein
MYHATQKWVIERGIFPDGNPVVRPFEESVAHQAAE